MKRNLKRNSELILELTGSRGTHKNKHGKLALSFAVGMLASVVTSIAIAQSSATSSTTATTLAPAAGTSTLAAPAAQAPLGRFGLTYTADTSFGPANDLKPVITNIAGINYKLSNTEKIALKQYWDQAVGYKGKPEDNMVTWPVLQYSTKLKGILGSDDVAPLFWYYIPTSNNRLLENGFNDERISSNGNLRMDLEIPWTLTPKWTVSYYLNPRQSMLPGQQVLKNPDGSFKDLKNSTTTLLHYGFAYYNVNDIVQPYAGMGLRHDFLTNDGFANTKNAILPVLGCNFTFNKNIVVSAEINEDGVGGIPVTKTTYSESSPGVYNRKTESVFDGLTNSDALNYELIVAISI